MSDQAALSLGRIAQDLDSPGPPLAGRVLVGGDAHFLAGGQAFRTALSLRVGKDFRVENDDRVRHLNATEEVVASFDEYPAGRS